MNLSLMSSLGRFFVSLAFAVLPFIFALQVVGGTALLGVVPYLFLAISASLIILSSGLSKVLACSRDFALLDVLVIVLVIWSLSHAFLGLILETSTFHETARFIFIFIVSAWVYFYVVFFSRTHDHEDILTVTVIATLVLGLHWCIETVSKFVLQRTSMHQILTADYIMSRNQLSYEQLNTSVLYPEYRAYGLLDKHTTTGALVSLGGFAAIGRLSSVRLDWRILVGCGYLAILTVGMATLAWLSFVLLMPFAILLSERFMAPVKVGLRSVLYCVALCVFFLSLLGLGGVADDLVNKIIWLFSIQLSFVLNVDGSLAHTSWWQIYVAETNGYIQYLSHNPWAAVFGEGYLGYGDVKFLRGGDAAIYEFLATYGWPMSLFLLIGIVLAVISGCRTLLLQPVCAKATGFLVFSCAGLVFLLLSLGHYNTFFNKSVFIFLFLFLGLVRRYTCSSWNLSASEKS